MRGNVVLDLKELGCEDRECIRVAGYCLIACYGISCVESSGLITADIVM